MSDRAEPAGRVGGPVPSRPRRLRLAVFARTALPALATASLAVVLVFTIFFTELEWPWIAFLSGVLVASVLSLVSASWKTQWRLARRTAQVAKIKDRLAAETAMRGRAEEQLARELALHQQDRERQAKNVELLRESQQRLGDAESRLSMLEGHVPVAACILDAELRCRFHTRVFAKAIGKYSSHIEGRALDELLGSDAPEALRSALAAALGGRPAVADLSIRAEGGGGERVVADLVPHRGAADRVTGIVVILRESGQPADDTGGPLAAIRNLDEVEAPASGLVLTDEAGHEVYLRSLTEELMGGGDPQARIREAIEPDGFDLHAQDIVPLRPELQPARMVELLIRMRDEEEQHLPPGAFFPAAEHYGMMPDIDRWVVRKIAAACAASETHRRAEFPLLCIDTARSTMADRAFPGFVADTLRHHGLRADLLCFEVSDNDVIAAPADAARFAGLLRQLGCRVSLDGFGGAGIGFDHVKHLPLDYLKIDGRIILAIARDPVVAAKVTAIRRDCEQLGVRTVAQMVESEDVLRKPGSLGVDYAQGFGIARPRPLGASID